MISAMSATVAAASQPVLLELHEALRAVDPARWRADVAEALRERLHRLQERLATLAESEEGATLREKLTKLVELLRSIPESSAAERWIEFRSRVSPAYEGLVAALRDHAVHLPSLRPTNYTRSLFHVLNGMGVLAVIELVPKDYLIYPAGSAFVLVWFLETIRRVSPAANARIMALFGPVAHPYEHHAINSGTWYVTALMILALMRIPMLGAVGVAILGFADPAAALIGRRFGTVKLVNGRSLQGTTTFILVGFLAALSVMLLLHPAIGLMHSLLLASVMSIVAAIAELFSRRIDDNLSIPLTAAAAGSLLLALLAA